MAVENEAAPGSRSPHTDNQVHHVRKCSVALHFGSSSFKHCLNHVGNRVGVARRVGARSRNQGKRQSDDLMAGPRGTISEGTTQANDFGFTRN
ncbi:hypothetical protein PAMC26510_26970 [Caballeronia sordidicola]|uniref:Uncharacterized protein n=1 Tax=Caballeronia sordidicola TaxID=196367 RepID=A0A2C9XWB5_CABSO|nr:hypothetical protein PAMC26510_26970 [Caballeronia sordidicola]